MFQVGAVTIPNVRIGKWSTIGPRATVIRNVPDNVKLTGIPAQPVRD